MWKMLGCTLLLQYFSMNYYSADKIMTFAWGVQNSALLQKNYLSSSRLIPVKRLDDIAAIARSVPVQRLYDLFEILIDENFPGPAAVQKVSTGKYMMKVNPRILKSLSSAAQKLILYHEVGHYFLGHLERPYLADRSYQRNIELEADAFAAFFFKYHEKSVDQLKEFLNSLATMETWPTGSERVEVLRSILFSHI